MEKRSLFFIFTFSMVFMGLYFMQDPKPKIPEGKQAGENAVAAADADAEDGAEEDGADTADGESELSLIHI